MASEASFASLLKAAREAFGEVVAEYVDEVKGGVVRFGGRYLPASTGQPLETLLRRVIRGAA